MWIYYLLLLVRNRCNFCDQNRPARFCTVRNKHLTKKVILYKTLFTNKVARTLYICDAKSISKSFLKNFPKTIYWGLFQDKIYPKTYEPTTDH